MPVSYTHLDVYKRQGMWRYDQVGLAATAEKIRTSRLPGGESAFSYEAVLRESEEKDHLMIPAIVACRDSVAKYITNQMCIRDRSVCSCRSSKTDTTIHQDNTEQKQTEQEEVSKDKAQVDVNTVSYTHLLLPSHIDWNVAM